MTTDVSGIRDVVSRVVAAIKAKRSSGEKLVSFDFTSYPRMVFGPIIMTALSRLGYISYLLLSGGKEGGDYEWLYVDLTRMPVIGSVPQKPVLEEES